MMIDVDVCPFCKQPWTETETILPNGELGCRCRRNSVRVPQAPYFSHQGVSIYHGRAVEVMSTFPAERIDLIATSPPYNCRMPYENVVDEMPWDEYYHYMGLFLDECYRLLVPGGILAINVPGVVRFQRQHRYHNTWRDFDPSYVGHNNGAPVHGRGRIEPLGFRLMQMMFERDNHTREPIIWVKGGEGRAYCTSSAMGSDNNPYMRPAHELILLGSKQHWHHRGGTGRRGPAAVPMTDYTKDVWHIQPVSHPKHPATWPAEIPKRLMLLFVHAPSALVLDPFMGTGITLDIARRLGHHAMGIDASQSYCEMAAHTFSQGMLV